MYLQHLLAWPLPEAGSVLAATAERAADMTVGRRHYHLSAPRNKNDVVENKDDVFGNLGLEYIVVLLLIVSKK